MVRQVVTVPITQRSTLLVDVRFPAVLRAKSIDAPLQAHTVAPVLKGEEVTIPLADRITKIRIPMNIAETRLIMR
jgi:hypothetical protein